jgi:hypothetical protein
MHGLIGDVILRVAITMMIVGIYMMFYSMFEIRSTLDIEQYLSIEEN